MSRSERCMMFLIPRSASTWLAFLCIDFLKFFKFISGNISRKCLLNRPISWSVIISLVSSGLTFSSSRLNLLWIRVWIGSTEIFYTSQMSFFPRHLSNLCYATTFFFYKASWVPPSPSLSNERLCNPRLRIDKSFSGISRTMTRSTPTEN